MLAAPKYVPFDAWDNRWAGRESTIETRHRIKAFPTDANDLTQFTIESCHCYPRREISFTLFGRMLSYPSVPICRYEVQNGRHRNPAMYPPRFVGNRVLHTHVYNERVIRHGGSWDACADVIGPAVDRVQEAIDRLTPLFLEQLSIEVHDPDVSGELFGR